MKESITKQLTKFHHISIHNTHIERKMTEILFISDRGRVFNERQSKSGGFKSRMFSEGAICKK